MKYAVCPDCQGRGGSSRYLGAFTAEDWDDQDQDFRDDYVAGHYDRPCDTCKGERVVQACHCGQPIEYGSNIWQGTYPLSGCWEHLSEDDQEALDADAMSRAELAAGC